MWKETGNVKETDHVGDENKMKMDREHSNEHETDLHSRPFRRRSAVRRHESSRIKHFTRTSTPKKSSQFSFSKSVNACCLCEDVVVSLFVVFCALALVENGGERCCEVRRCAPMPTLCHCCRYRSRYRSRNTSFVICHRRVFEELAQASTWGYSTPTMGARRYNSSLAKEGDWYRRTVPQIWGDV
jgi:hypothetical protein